MTSKGPACSRSRRVDYLGAQVRPPGPAAREPNGGRHRGAGRHARAGQRRCPRLLLRRSHAERSPGRRPAWVKRASWAVVNASGRPPAFGPTELVRHGMASRSWTTASLGLAAATHHCHDRIAGAEAGRARPGAPPPRPPSPVPGCRAATRGRRVEAPRLHQVGAVEPGGATRTRIWPGPGSGSG